MEQKKEFVRRISRASLESSRKGKLGCFPGDLSEEKAQKGEEKETGGMRATFQRPVSA